MSDIMDIQVKLQDTAAMLARSRSEFARRPESRSLAWDIRSLEKRQSRLEAELAAIAAAQGRDVCSYRIMPEQERVKLTGLVDTLGDYQSLVSVFYDAVKRGPKTTTHLSADAAEETALDFAYAFAGSVGFVFTVPNDRNLFDRSEFDDAIRLIFEASKARAPKEILAYARRLGSGPIRALFRWADANAKSSFSVDVEWRRGDDVRQKELIQAPEFQRLRQAINETSDQDQIEFMASGLLVGADAANRTFHFQPDSGGDIRGSSGAIIDETRLVQLPKRYSATIRKTRRIFFSTEEERVSHELLHLEPI